MKEGGYITLERDVQAVRIPSGDQITLPEGTAVIITQALGGSYTVVIANQAGLYRISGGDAAALGQDVGETAQNLEGPFEEEQLWKQLRNCYDPEIPVNIVDLGLIYSLEVSDATEGGKHVRVQMTLTAPGCGMGPSLAADAEQRLLSVPGVTSASVELTWNPPWSPDRISQQGREKLGMV
jgi:probable FeS assembly SUF system protein SufT